MTQNPGNDRTPQNPHGQTPSQPGQPGGWDQGQQPPAYGQPSYGYPGQWSAPAPPRDHPRATTALVLGIVGIAVLGGIVSPFAWVIGSRAVKEIDASGGHLGGRSQAQAGKILGIVGTVILIFWVAVFVIVIIAAVATSGISTA